MAVGSGDTELKVIIVQLCLRRIKEESGFFVNQNGDFIRLGGHRTSVGAKDLEVVYLRSTDKRSVCWAFSRGMTLVVCVSLSEKADDAAEGSLGMLIEMRIEALGPGGVTCFSIARPSTVRRQ